MKVYKANAWIYIENQKQCGKNYIPFVCRPIALNSKMLLCENNQETKNYKIRKVCLERICDISVQQIKAKKVTYVYNTHLLFRNFNYETCTMSYYGKSIFNCE